MSASTHSPGLIWLAVAGFVLFVIGMVNQIVLRATFGVKEWPLKPALSNSLLVVGGILIVVGVVMRNG